VRWFSSLLSLQLDAWQRVNDFFFDLYAYIFFSRPSQSESLPSRVQQNGEVVGFLPVKSNAVADTYSVYSRLISVFFPYISSHNRR